MTIAIEAKKTSVDELEFPIGFWPAFCVETPVSQVLECVYIENKMKIRYEHDGYVGAWISEDEALTMHRLLLDFINTDDYINHRYFGTRQSQMDAILEFLPECGGFRLSR